MADDNRKVSSKCSSCGAVYKIPVSMLGKNATCKKCKTTFKITESKEEKLPILAKLALQLKIIDKPTLSNTLIAYTKKKKENPKTTLIEFLVSYGGINPKEMRRLVSAREALEVRHFDKIFSGKILKDGVVTKKQIQIAISRQGNEFKKLNICKPVSDILVESGIISVEQRNFYLSDGKAKGVTSSAISPSTGISNKKERVEIEINKILQNVEGLPKSLTISKLKKIFLPSNINRKISEFLEDENIVLEEKSKKVPVKIEEPSETTVVSPVIEAGKSSVKEPEKEIPPVSQGDAEKEKVEVKEKADQNIEAKVPLDKPDKLDKPSESAESELEPEDKAEKEKKESGNKISGTVLPGDFFDIIIKEGNLEAYIQVNNKPPEGFSVDDIKEFLILNNISYGFIDDSILDNFITSEELQQKPFLVAEGIHPQYGEDGTVTYLFDTDHVKVGALDESGHIDFRDRGEIPHVGKGSIVAEIKPVVQGLHGIDIFSNPILVPKVSPLKLKCEKGTSLSKDGLTVTATCDGQPVLHGGRRLAVLGELNIDGDIGFETGHVTFDGNINVSGTVQSGFNVRGANLTALEILGADVDVTGSIHVIAGISGAQIKAEGGIKAKYINKSEISCFGDLLIEKEIIDSKIENGGYCNLPMGKIISSEVSSKKGVECRDVILVN